MIRTIKRKAHPLLSISLQGKLAFFTKIILLFIIVFTMSRYSQFYLEYPILANIIYGLNTFLAGSVLISVGRFLLISWYSRRSRDNDRLSGNVVLGINQFAGILNVAFVILGLMLAVDINPKDFLTSITLVAMAIALLFRDYITNMISGLLIMFSDRFTVGDFIKINEDQGRIIDITLSNIVINNEDDDIVMIPNNTAFTENIINQTIENTRKMVIDFNLPFGKAHKRDELERRLIKVIESMSDEVVKDSVKFRVVSVSHTDVRFKLNLLLNSKIKARKSRIKDRILSEVLAFEQDGDKD